MFDVLRGTNAGLTCVSDWKIFSYGRALSHSMLPDKGLFIGLQNDIRLSGDLPILEARQTPTLHARARGRPTLWPQRDAGLHGRCTGEILKLWKSR